MAQFKFNTIQRSQIERSRGGAVMLNAIDHNGDDNLIITGLPGSGKTTITLKRAERLSHQGLNILVLTYQNLLCTGLINSADDNAKDSIKTFYKWFYDKFGWLDKSDKEEDMKEKMKSAGLSKFDEILIDEGQDFKFRVYGSLAAFCNRMTAGADNAQQLHEEGLKASDIEEFLENEKHTTSYTLDYNYRNTYQIFNFARYFLPESERANNEQMIRSITRTNGTYPKVYQVLSEDEEDERIRQILEENENNNLAVLLYFKDEVDDYHERIKILGFTASKWYNRNTPSEINNILVTTLTSAKGLEFNTVLMPKMEKPIEYEHKTPKHYYVACTRAINRLYLIYKSQVMPNDLTQFDSETYELVYSKDSNENVNREASEPNDDLPF